MKNFAKTVSDFEKRPILDVWQDSKYFSGYHDFISVIYSKLVVHL